MTAATLNSNFDTRSIMKTLLIAVVAVLLLGANSAWAANRFVRAGAAGAGNGTDWTNAYSALPDTLVRGDTYYIAGGSYPAYTFDDPQSGTLLITIKKATAADHGTDAGWQASYGTAQATFNSTLRFATGNYVLDGQTRNESNWFDGGSYGIRIAHNNQDQNIIISGGSASSNITVKHVFVDAIYQNLPTSTTLRRYAIDTDTYGGSVATGLVFTRMYVYGSNNVWFLRTTDGTILEYSASDGVTGNSANHGEIVNLYYSGNNAVIRYNHWRNAFLSGGGTALVAITYADGMQFYGNVAQNFQVGDGAVGFNGYYSSRNRVYNNTFVGGKAASGTAWGSGSDNLVFNNLWVGCAQVGIEGTHDYNAFSDGNNRGEANAQVNVPTSIFVNYAGGDLRLASDTAPGTSVSSVFGVDLTGRLRSADGKVSRGAYDFVSGAATQGPPAAPTNLVAR
jgi:hypothetical protein